MSGTWPVTSSCAVLLGPCARSVLFQAITNMVMACSAHAADSLASMSAARAPSLERPVPDALHRVVESLQRVGVCGHRIVVVATDYDSSQPGMLVHYTFVSPIPALHFDARERRNDDEGLREHQYPTSRTSQPKARIISSGSIQRDATRSACSREFELGCRRRMSMSASSCTARVSAPTLDVGLDSIENGVWETMNQCSTQVPVHNS